MSRYETDIAWRILWRARYLVLLVAVAVTPNPALAAAATGGVPTSSDRGAASSLTTAGDGTTGGDHSCQNRLSRLDAKKSTDLGERCRIFDGTLLSLPQSLNGLERHGVHRPGFAG